MRSEYRERMAFLRDRNAKAVSLRDLRERGLPAEGFEFVEEPRGRDMIERFRERSRGLPEVELRHRDEAFERTRGWLGDRRDETLCLVTGAGMLTAGAGRFLESFDVFRFFDPPDRPWIFLCTPTLDAGLSCEVECEFDRYYLTIWPDEGGSA